MTQDNESKPAVATIAQLKKAFPDSTADWREEMIEAEATVDDAREFHVEELRRQLAESKAETKAAEAVKVSGVDAVEDGKAPNDEDDPTDPVAEYDRRVSKEMGLHRCDRRAACVRVAKANPDLHEGYLRATNPQRAQQEYIGDRREMLK